MEHFGKAALGVGLKAGEWDLIGEAVFGVAIEGWGIETLMRGSAGL